MNKDHYEVLGVRRSASATEIELAYKGRRAQYHPDKYQGTDAQTLHWATTQMQEVNAAYAVLSDERRRAQFDAAVAEPDDQAAPNEAPTLQALLHQRLVPYVGFSRTYFAPGIPLKKLSNALQSYGGGIKAEDVLVLIDSTVFGGAKEGVMLTEREIHSKELGSAPTSMPWGTLRTLATAGAGLYVNGLRVIDCAMVDPPELARLFAVVQEFVESMRQAPPRPEPTSAGRTSPGARSDSSEEYRPMYQTAKSAFLDMCEHIEEWEDKLDQVLIDRDNAAAYFGHLEACIQDPRRAEAAWGELSLIAVLSKCVTSFGPKSKNPPAALCAERDADSQMVEELRSLMRLLVEVREEYRQKDRTEQFFRR